MAVEHKITHHFQPTNHTCSQASMAMLLSFFGRQETPETIASIVPTAKNTEGEEIGTLSQQLATWAISEGYEVAIYSADYQVLDLSWADLNDAKKIERMQAAKQTRNVGNIGKEFSELYLQAYIDFLQAGGDLQIVPYISSDLLNKLLVDSPVFVSVNFNVLYNQGRSQDGGLRQAQPDDLEGGLANHSIVLYGKSDEGNYLIADPWQRGQRLEIESERLLIAIASAQLECDNFIFQIREKK